MDRQDPQKIAIPAWAAVAARLVVGAVLAAAGAYKAAAPVEEFSLVIESYQIAPLEMTLSLAAILPWVQMWLGFSLILGYWIRPSALGAGTLLACFIAALASLKARGIVLPHCGCFGGPFHPSPDATMVSDAVLLGLSFLAYRGPPSRLSLDSWVLGE
ncbi:MAG: DoxX family protein [Elusimicrobia bacterium]|nr:DoxX family protein [Elusimicrobiota bacterium]